MLEDKIKEVGKTSICVALNTKYTNIIQMTGFILQIQYKYLQKRPHRRGIHPLQNMPLGRPLRPSARQGHGLCHRQGYPYCLQAQAERSGGAVLPSV